MGTYCKRILSPTFWGGEPELLVLATILRRPIMVRDLRGENEFFGGEERLTLLNTHHSSRGRASFVIAWTPTHLPRIVLPFFLTQLKNGKITFTHVRACLSQVAQSARDQVEQLRANGY